MRKPLAWFTVGFTFLLMTWGNLVSATGSGLACPDWPLCHGTLTPPFRTDIVFEWGHRVLAFLTAVLIVANILLALRGPTAGPSLRRAGRTLLGLLAAQIVLGGVTVLLGLSVLVSTIHLLIASLVFTGLIAVAAAITWPTGFSDHADDSMGKPRRLSLSLFLALLGQLLLGALVRHGHAGMACPEFPACLGGGFLPIPFTFETGLAFVHRWWGVALLGVLGHLAFACRKLPGVSRITASAFLLGLVQVALGVATVVFGLSPFFRAVHAASGYLLWGMASFAAIRLGAFGLFMPRAEAASHAG